MTDDKSGAGQDIGLIEKTFLMGIGAAVLAKEKTEELAEELIRRGKITREESESFINKLAAEAERASQTAQGAVTHGAEQAIAGVGLASAKDVDEIRAELTEIKALIAALRPVGESTPVEAPSCDDDL